MPRLVSWLLSVPPRSLVLAMGAALGMLLYFLGVRRRVAMENARLALGDEAAARAAVKGAYRNLGVAMAEFLLAVRLSDRALEEAVRFEHVDRLHGALAAGKGVVVVMGHFGNWELFGTAAGRRGYKFYAITRRLKGRLNQGLVHAARALSGMRELGPKGSFNDAVAALRAGEAVAVIIDQNMLRSRGVFVDFFGRKACTTPAPAILAQRTGAAVVGAFPVREGPMRYRVIFEGPFDPPQSAEEHTQRLALLMESYVRRYPDHWFWPHRRWKTRPD